MNRCWGMVPVRHRSGVAVGVLVLAAVLAGCEDPQEPAPVSAGIPGHYDATQLAFSFGVESTGGAFAALRLIGTEARFDAETGSVHVQVSLRNDSEVAVPGPRTLTVFDFTPADVEPVNAETCSRREATGNALICMYVHAGTYGDDDLLSPGEVSTPVEWILRDTSGESFAFRVRLGSQQSAAIAGIVFEDRNGNGVRDPEDPVRIDAEVLLREDAGTRTARTDSAGLYAFPVERAGLYQVDKSAEAGWNITTPHPYEILIIKRADGTLSGFGRAHFGCQRQNMPAEIPVAGIVFDDIDRDGEYDELEPGIPGVEIFGATLQCPTFAPIRAITGRDGRYTLLLPGCPPPYAVSRVEVPGFVGTTGNHVYFKEPPVAGAALRADFGLATIDSTCVGSAAELIQELGRAYGRRDLARYRELLVSAPEAHAEFLFFLPEPIGGMTAWGYDEESRIHARMFEPANTPPGEPPVPVELWVRSIAVTLVQQEAFAERTDLYTSAGGWLDPARWRAMDARYSTDVFWDLAGGTDYHVVGGANFVVVEDLSKHGCDASRFAVFHWEDLGAASDPAVAAATTWARMKSLYQ